MRTLEDIRGRCHIDDFGHWLWRGCVNRDGAPRIYAPDHTRGGMSTQVGYRAVQHAKSGKAIPDGLVVWNTCGKSRCLNPEHMRCGTSAEYGDYVAASGKERGRPSRVAANREINRRRSSLTPELIAEIQNSSETGRVLAARLGMDFRAVSNIRVNGVPSFGRPAGGVFAALRKAA